MAQRKNLLAGGAEQSRKGKRAPGPPAGGSGDGSGVDGAAGSAGGGSGFGRGGRIKVLPDPERDLACCRMPLTDLGNAERWRLRYGQDFRFCPEIGWHAWDGRRWRLLGEEKDKPPAELIWSVILTVRAIRNEALLVAALGGLEEHSVRTEAQAMELARWAGESQDAARSRYLKGDSETGERAAWLDDLALSDWAPRDSVVDFGKRKSFSGQLAAWAKTSEGAAMLGRIIHWVKGFADIVVRPDTFDKDVMAFNVLNGTLRLQQVNRKRAPEEIARGKSEWHTVWDIKLHPHERADLLTKLAPVEYKPRATCPAYDAFIERVQPDAAMRRFIHQWGGLSLTGDIGEHKLAFFFGGGRNGKGTWVELLAHMMGDYAGSIGVESLMDSGAKRRGDQATPDLAALPGVRFLRVAEPETGMRWNDGLVKQLTGGDPVKARHLNKGFFEFFPNFKLTMSGNNKPAVKDLSHGMWARMQLVPWNETIPEEEIDRRLPDKLKAEASGVLNRMIAGLLDWRSEGLIVPEQVRTATRAYRDQSDDLGRFLAQLCEVSDDHDHVRAPARELWKLYRAWCEHAGGSPWHEKAFKLQMEQHGFDAIPSNGMKWLGVRIRPGVTLEEVQAGHWPSATEGSAASSGGGSGGADDWDDDPDVDPFAPP